jgi:hypothetical protein
LKFGNSAFYHLNPIGAHLLGTITGKAAEFSMPSHKHIPFFSSNGRPPGDAVIAGVFLPFQPISDFSNLSAFFLPPHPGRFKQSFSRTFRRPFASGDGVNSTENRAKQKWPTNK